MMVKKLVICDKCDFKGVVNIIEEENSDDMHWDCPDCSKRHINEGTII
jgi:DNA-directed RNA polymerase subunit RPC12/RpoP